MASNPSTSIDHAKVADIRQWLIDGAPGGHFGGRMFTDLCVSLCDAGFMLTRVNIFIRTLHPDVFGIRLIWRPNAELQINMASFDTTDSDAYRASPLAAMIETGAEVRLKLDDPASHRFPIVPDLIADGATDYIVLPMLFSDGAMQVSTWVTNRPGGYGDVELDALRSLIAPFARVVEIISLRRMASILIDTYVGNQAGERILAGHIRRGYTETMNAAIWLSDMRGFTALSDRLPPAVIVEVLNCYFDCQVPAIRERGGDVLKFMGDGLLAVFPIENGNREAACARALDAARVAREAIHKLCYVHDEGQLDGFRFGVALHIGDVLYGNIGGGRTLAFDDGFIGLQLRDLEDAARSSSRLDFTCIGPAVNLAARLEKIASRLGRTIVASGDFAGACPDTWRDLGEFPISGFAAPSRVFGLPDED
jgi:adenylate cyclase